MCYYSASYDFKNLPSGPKSYGAFRETGPWAPFWKVPVTCPVLTLRGVSTSRKVTGESETNKIAAESKHWSETSTVFAKTTDCCRHP